MKRVLIFSLLLITSLSSVADVILDSDLRLFADSLYSRGMYKQAAIEYSEYIKANRNASDLDVLLFKYAEALRLSGAAEQAVPVYIAITKINNSSLKKKAYIKCASICLELNRFDQAKNLLGNVINDKSNEDELAEALFLRAKILSYQNDVANAILDYELLLEKYPNNKYRTYVKLFLSSLYLKSENTNYAKVESYLNDLLSDSQFNESNHEELTYILGCAKYKQKKYKEAKDIFSKIVFDDSSSKRLLDSYIYGAWSYYFDGMIIEARDLATRGINYIEKNNLDKVALSKLYEIKGCSFQNLNDYENAVKSFEKALEINYDNQELCIKLAKSYFSNKKYDECIELLKKNLDKTPYREDYLWILAESYNEIKRYQEAIQYYRLFAKEFPSNANTPNSLYRIGNILLSLGKFEESANTFVELFEKHNDSVLASDALFLAAQSYSKFDVNKAIGLFRRFVSAYPNSEYVPLAIYRRGLLLLKNNNNNDSINTFIELTTKYPNSQYTNDSYYWIGYIFYLQDNFINAENNLRKVNQNKLAYEHRSDYKQLFADVLQKNSKDDESVKVLIELLKDNNASKLSPQKLSWLSEQLSNRKMFDLAIKAALLIIDIDGVSKAWMQTSYMMAGNAALAAKNVNDAEKYFNLCKQINIKSREYLESIFHLGELQMDKKDYKSAEDCFEEILKITTDLPEFSNYRLFSYIGYGDCAIAQGKKEEGIKRLLVTTLLFSNDKIIPPVMDKLIGLLVEENRIEEADAIKAELIDKYSESPEAKKYAQ